MRNNKGYTLVELLVTLAVFAIIMGEVGNMMMNSSKLYRNGTYEVELQTEAQQIVQQMEELLIDVNHSVSVNYQESLGSDYITISNNTMGLSGDGDYTIYNFVVMKDPELGYGNLYFNKECSDPLLDVSDVLMAEYVQSISLNMSEYSHDVVTLNVSMNNGRYGYQASQDIYLRNAVGSGGKGGSGGGTFDYDLDVLRFREYDLSALYDTEDISFTFAWDSEYEARASNVYEWGNSSHTKLRTNGITNVDDVEHQYFTLIATGDDGPEPTVRRIRVGTKPVEFGTNGVGLMNAYVGTSMDVISAVPVQGIDVTKADAVTMSLQYYTGPTSDIQEFGVYDENGSKQGLTVEYRDNPDYMQVMLGTPLYWKMNEAVNTFDIYSNKVQADQGNFSFPTSGDYDVRGYEAYMAETGTPLYFIVTLKYNGYQTVTGRVYVYPYNMNMGSQESTFWDSVGWTY